MKRIKPSTIFTALLSLSVLLPGCNRSGKNMEYMIVGYVSGYRQFDFSKIDPTKLTHINYAFANIIDGRVSFGNTMIDNTEMNSEDIRRLIRLKEINPDLKVLVSVGGWGWSGNFSDAALNDSTRRIFAYSAAKFVREYQLDGIDIDWEYPNQPGAGNTYRQEDIHNYTLMLRTVREHLDSMAVEQGRKEKYLLTIATGGDSAFVANTELGEVALYTDFINIMSYDLHNGLTWQSGHHANLYISEYDTPYGDAVDRSVRMHLEAGVPASELNIGVPFYGRMWKGVEPGTRGLYRQAGTTGSSISYSEVMTASASEDFTQYFDTSAAAPYLWNERDSVFISFDNEASLALKMKYVKANKLGGVMYWEYTEDPEGKLLDVLFENLKKTDR